MDSRRVDLLLKYALAVAGQEDQGYRELGPIHLLKYAYLADLCYAETHGGQTFSGALWRFYHFGPWTESVYERIQPVVQSIGAVERRFSVPGYDDGVRWSLSDEHLLDALEREVPWEVSRCLKKAVHEYGSDTHALLHYVYATRPMRRAAPGELLDFSPDSVDIAADITTQVSSPAPARVPSKAETKRKELAARELRCRVQRRLEERARALRAPTPPPRYDAVFDDGQNWLDGLAGEPIQEESGELTFSDEIWKSRGRSESGLP
jgi:hypothetical protein